MSAIIMFGQAVVKDVNHRGAGGSVSLDWFRERFPEVQDKTLRNRVAELTRYPSEDEACLHSMGGGCYLTLEVGFPMRQAIIDGDDVYVRRLAGEKREPQGVRQRREKLRVHAWPLIGRQHCTCLLCGRRRIESPVDVEIDHIKALSKGGVLVGAVCTGCHRYKGTGTVQEARARLKELGVPVKDSKADVALQAALDAGIEAPASWWEK